LVGIDHIGIGSDYDGIPRLPIGLEDVSTYPQFIKELLVRGYSDEDIKKIMNGNILRVWKEVRRLADD
jgi:membrane dipeptidase